jgi:hypothetical protein
VCRALAWWRQDEAANSVHALRMNKLMEVGDDLLGLIKLLHDSSKVTTCTHKHSGHFNDGNCANMVSTGVLAA